MVEFTCIVCEFKYDYISGDTEERMCLECIDNVDELESGGFDYV